MGGSLQLMLNSRPINFYGDLKSALHPSTPTPTNPIKKYWGWGGMDILESLVHTLYRFLSRNGI